MIHPQSVPHRGVPGTTARPAPNHVPDLFPRTMTRDRRHECSKETAHVRDVASLTGQPGDDPHTRTSHRQGEQKSRKKRLPDCINCGRRPGGIENPRSAPQPRIPRDTRLRGAIKSSCRPASQQHCSCSFPDSAQDDRGSLESAASEPVARPAQARIEFHRAVWNGPCLSFCPLAIRINCLRSSSRGVLSKPSCTANV